MKLNVVPARTGLLWVRLGIRTFLRQPLALAGLFFMYMAVVLVVTQIPFVGMLIGGILVPAATLGLMAATAEASSGRFPMPTVLVSAFRAGRERLRSMLVLGVIYTVASIIATTLASLLAGGAPAPAPAAGPEQPQVDTGMLVTLLLHTPLFLMFWHAPALVHWHGITPAKSLFFSVVACWRNLGALLVYGLAWMGVFLLVGTVLGLIGALAGGANLARAVMVPTALLMAAMFTSSIWFTFRDSFTADDPAAPPGLDGRAG
ncbi:BPSS1780 family membrane protein [Ramlibacter tataouinensis]|uniref:BPSS1780 family membrane protein n=1 Tax=Ramlibacter tataouinensis TaxID=94132 RepID=UPI0022F3907F|nr:BPSS1780 family membrane protein [Ramlibacter tataouinensis]WBY02612.1 BPSS1780 family membrane protein [Ramlibacter tataouinensis]